MAQTSTAIRAVALPSGEAVAALGQGTWGMSEKPKRRDDEIAALRLGLDLGMTLIDTAEMYGGGGAEEIVGAAIAGRRDEVFLVSKVLPSHATRRGTVAACRASLARLGVEQLDLYLLHWREKVPLDETLEAFDMLTRSREIRYWGVSNFRCRRHDGADPFAPRRRRRNRSSALQPVAPRDRVRPASHRDHVRENRGAHEKHVSDDDLRELDRAFPPPSRKIPLEVI